MAEETSKQPRRIKKPKETIRQQSEKAAQSSGKPRRIHKTAGTIAKPFKTAHRIGRKEYYIPLPENRFGRWLNKRRHIIPRYFRDAYAEVRQVTWPSRKETWKLTGAVFIFAAGFSLIVAITDYGLDKVFRKVFLQ